MIARVILLALTIVACAPDTRGPSIDVERALAHVRVLAGDIGIRSGDSAQARAAAAYIGQQLEVEPMPVGRVELPTIEVLGKVFRTGHVAQSSDPNLIARFGPATGKALLIMAHYDSVPTSPGAIDNAAAVAVLIELARTWSTDPPAQPVIVAFTANEETGLVGAEALAEYDGHEVDFAVALDLIGGDGALSINGASTLIGEAELRWLAGAADRAGVVVRAPLPHRVVSRWWPQVERSDHGPFTRRGIRAIHLYDRGHDGDWIDLAYHSPADGPARVRPESLDELARVLRALANEPVPAAGGDGVWLPIAANTVVPRWTLLVLCFACALAAVVLLSTTRRGRAGSKLGVVVAIACYGFATACVVALERVLAGDHVAPWLHAPGAWLVGELLVLGGLLGLVTRLAARFAPWGGERRYLALAVISPLAIGGGWLALDAPELAWVWLVPAMLAAIAPRLGRAGLVLVLPLVLPVILVLGAHQVREAAWNGFWPVQIPFGVWVATLGFPSFAGLGWYLRARDRSGPLGTLVLPLGCLLATITGIVVLVAFDPTCSAAQFHGIGLACELPVGVR